MTTTPYINDVRIFFLVTLYVMSLLLRCVPAVNNFITTFGNTLQLKAFPSTSSNEHYKFAILRFIFGSILLARAINIQLLLLAEERYGLVGLMSAMDMAAAVMLMLGFMTQFVLAFLIFFMWHVGERVLATVTLGNDIAAILALLLILTNAGRYLSIDALVIKRWHCTHKLLLYSAAAPCRATIALAKFAALFSYWAVCVYSLSMHINEPAWTSGVAGPLVLSSNLMSAWNVWFESAFIASDAATFMAKVSLWLMMIWYAAVLPFTLMGGWWRTYVITWGLLFLFLSSMVFMLGSLAEIEFVLWAALFWTVTGLDSKSKILLFYDDKCNLCDKTVQVISCLDVFNRISLKPVSQHENELVRFNIGKEAALVDLYGVDEHSGEVRSGYVLYFWLAQRMVLLWPLLPVLFVGRLFGIGAWLYQNIAKRRVALFGVCQLARPKAKHIIKPGDGQEPGIVFLSIFSHVILLGSIYLACLPAPYLGVSGDRNVAVKAAEFYGIAPINVFNMADLKMAVNWFTLDNIELNEKLPIFTKEGTRLQYHNSDRIYFGNTLQFRRGEIGHEGCGFERWRTSIEYLTRVWMEHAGLVPGTYHFLYTHYHQPLPDIKQLLQNHYVVQKYDIRCQMPYELTVSQNNGLIEEAR